MIHENTLGSDAAKASQGNTQTNSRTAGDVQDEWSSPATPPSDGRASSCSASCGALVGHDPAVQRPHSPQPPLLAMAQPTAAPPSDVTVRGTGCAAPAGGR
jgi:hypothetical protein